MYILILQDSDNTISHVSSASKEEILSEYSQTIKSILNDGFDMVDYTETKDVNGLPQAVLTMDSYVCCVGVIMV